MPAGPNYTDANGFLRPGEDAPISPVSDWLDPFVEQFSDAIAALRGADLDVVTGTLATDAYTSTGNSGTTVYWGTLTINFPNPFIEAPTVVFRCSSGGSVVVTNVITVTETGFTVRVVRFAAALTTLGFYWSAIGKLA